MADGPDSLNDPGLDRVSFTGRMAFLPRRRAEALVIARGGAVAESVSRRTTMLVVGFGGWPVRSDGSVSQKLRRAETLRDEGTGIEIVSEPVFLERLGLVSQAQDARKPHDRPRVAEILGIDDRTLRRWEVMGLVQPSADGRFDFRDLVALRTIGELIARGVKPHAIASSVRGLSSVLPDLERPLAQLKLVADSGEVLAELGGALIDADGQWRLRFDPDETATGPSAPLPGARDEPVTAEAWFDRATALEEEGDYAGAERAYRAAIAGRSHFPEAHFNLGNVLRAMDRIEAAGEHFQLAATQAPRLAEAWYNLADTQESSGHIDVAITSLRRAVAIDPTFADAHFNLALCCTEVGQHEEAEVHWRAYLGLDTTSPWAAKARAALARLAHSRA